jgi:crossover junction endodeoxyribonuclease RuvC
MSNSGVAIFDEEGNPVKIISIPTCSKNEHKDRLRFIADKLLELRKEFPTNLIILESGFSRHAASTQAIFKTIGVFSYIFSDCRQETLAPSSIKKIITGKGTSDKKVVQEKILEKFPHLEFQNEDESDATGVAMAHFILLGIMKL